MVLENLKSAGVQQARQEDRITFTSIDGWPGDLICAKGRYVVCASVTASGGQTVCVRRFDGFHMSRRSLGAPHRTTRSCCEQTDLPIGGLLTDLKQRGLMETTLIQWGGEFGRTPGAEQRDAKTRRTEGRDHHPYGFSIWLAGGGIRGGQTYGATDDFGYRAIVDRTSTADLHATILYLLGLNHEALTYSHNSRDERLTDVYPARIIHPLLS